jgi:hypothetical protein
MAGQGVAFTHRVRLHFRSLAGLHVPFNVVLSNTQAVYASHGIKIEMASGQSVRLTTQEASRFRSVGGSCEWVVTGGEQYELQTRLGQMFSPFEITVIYVNRFDDIDIGGCGGHMGNRPACIVCADAGPWDTAHEVGHVLLGPWFAPVHEDDSSNLMFSISQRSKTPPKLNARQVAAMKSSACCARIAGAVR